MTNEEIRDAYIRAGCDLSVARSFLPSDTTEAQIIAAVSETPEIAHQMAQIERSVARVYINDALRRALTVLSSVIADMGERELLRLLPALLEAHAAGMPQGGGAGAGGGGAQNQFNILLQTLPAEVRAAVVTLRGEDATDGGAVGRGGGAGSVGNAGNAGTAGYHPVQPLPLSPPAQVPPSSAE